MKEHIKTDQGNIHYKDIKWFSYCVIRNITRIKSSEKKMVCTMDGDNMREILKLLDAHNIDQEKLHRKWGKSTLIGG